MVKKVIMNIDSSKVSRLDCIPVVVIKNCEPELSYILAELTPYILAQKVSTILVFQIDGRSYQQSLYLRIGESSTAKNYHLVSLFL